MGKVNVKPIGVVKESNSALMGMSDPTLNVSTVRMEIATVIFTYYVTSGKLAGFFSGWIPVGRPRIDEDVTDSAIECNQCMRTPAERNDFFTGKARVRRQAKNQQADQAFDVLHGKSI